ncbi:MAG: TetR/AcrR family transcriptional regulator [Pacificimonas sp.]
MARRSDHTPQELRALLIREGHELLAELGFARFSARAAAKRAGYSVGTIYNVFGSLDGYLVAINTHTFALWAAHLSAALEPADDDRIAALVHGYFSFAEANGNLWMAIYDHRLPDGMGMPEHDARARAALTQIVEEEVRRALPEDTDVDVHRLTRSLIAVVHGHCSFALTGTFALLEEPDAVGSALARVRETLSVLR